MASSISLHHVWVARERRVIMICICNRLPLEALMVYNNSALIEKVKFSELRTASNVVSAVGDSYVAASLSWLLEYNIPCVSRSDYTTRIESLRNSDTLYVVQHIGSWFNDYNKSKESDFVVLKVTFPHRNIYAPKVSEYL